MMDVPPGNGLSDPYGASEQAAYPWRGRLTCHPAPGRPGTADGTAPDERPWPPFSAAPSLPIRRFRRFAGGACRRRGLTPLRAAPCQARRTLGRVDGFIIGSEMRGLTRVRDQAGAFPFVEGLVALASDVRAALGPATKLTYAADWSE